MLLRDYRDLTGTYDKLVSIEMIEAVGWQYFPAFAKCAELTRPGGAMFLQAIVIQDELYEAEKTARSFSNKHIFPGGCLPSQARHHAPFGEERDADRVDRGDQRPLRAHARRLARSLQRRLAEPAATWLRRALRAPVELLPRVVGGGFTERRIRDLQIVLAKGGSRAERVEPAAAAAIPTAAA